MAVVTEFLPNNHLNENIINSLKPFHIIEGLFCFKKFQIKDDFLFPNSKIYTFMCLCVCAISVFIMTSSVLCQTTDWCTWSKSICAFAWSYHFIYILEYFINFFYLVLNTDHAVKIILNMQEVEQKIYSDLKKYRIMNTFLCIFVVVTQTVAAAFNHVKVYRHDFSSWQLLVFYATRFIIDIDVVYAIFVTDYTASRLFIVAVKLTTGSGLNDLLNLYLKLLKIFEAFKKMYSVPLLFYLAKFFVHCMIHVQFSLEWNKFHTGNLLNVLIYFVIWMIKTMTLLILLSRSCYLIEAAIATVKANSLDMMLKCDNEKSRKLYKNIVRVTSARYSRFCPYGVLTFDASMPLTLGSLMATYIVVMLQLALA